MLNPIFIYKLYIQSEFDTVAVAFNILCVVCLSWPTLYCYFATITTYRISAIGEDAYFSNWYNYPLVVQNFLSLIIARSQNNMQFSGMGLIHCNAETFGKVIAIQ